MITKYNAKDCTVTVDGVFITGLGEDMISWEKDEAYFETSVGAQGDIVKNEINNGIHTLSITVQQTSPQYGYLLGLAKRSEPFPVWVVNKPLGLKLGGTKANIAEAPEISLGASAEDATIAFTVFNGTTKVS